MTSLAFAQGLDAHVGQYLVSIGLLFFAFTTILAGTTTVSAAPSTCSG